MRIDLHTHTQKCKTGDGKKRKISPEDYVTKMAEQNVMICAITNHNKFDKSEYDQIVTLNPNLTLFTGIELDVDFHDERRHIVVIGNPKGVGKFHATFDGDPTRVYDTYSITFDDFVNKIELFQPNEIIVIPHFMDKDRGFKIHEKEELFGRLSDYVVILETAKLRSMGIVNDHEEHLSLIGSDVKDWDKYSGIDLPEIKFNIDSFEKFYELASDAKSFVKNFLNGAPKHNIHVNNLGEEIVIFDDINILFGEKGSGKTVLLKNYVYPYFCDAGKKVFLHEGKDYGKLYDDILRNHENTVTIDDDLYSVIIKETDYILQYSEHNNQNFIQGYVSYRVDTTKNKNSERILKTSSTFSNNIADTFETAISYAESYSRQITKVVDINALVRADGNSKDKELLDSELRKLSAEIQQRVVKKYKDIFIAQNTEQFLTTLKQSLRKKIGKGSKPNNIGFSKLVSQRLARYQSNKIFLDALCDIQVIQSTNIGSLPGKGEVAFETSVITLSESDRHKKDSVFDKLKIVQNRKIIRKLHNFSTSDFLAINEYFDSQDKAMTGAGFAREIVKKNSVIKIPGNDCYLPSEGEQAILSISGLLESYNYDCYLFDEVERGLGHKYISDYLIPRLKKLRDAGKSIVLSTHNANIAVNTLPSQVIYCNYPDDNDYYIGNMYSNELTGIKDGVIQSWEEKALIHLEGSEEMFSRRRNIYGI